MSLIATCPFCALKVRLSQNAVGASVECPRCRSYFTAADDSLVPEAGKSRDPFRPPVMQPAQARAPGVHPDAPPVGKPAAGGDEGRTDEQVLADDAANHEGPILGPGPEAPTLDAPAHVAGSQTRRVNVVLATQTVRLPVVEPWEAAALLAGSLALVTASVRQLNSLTIPLAALGLLLAIAAPLIRAGPSKLGALGPAFGVIVSAAVLICIWVRPEIFGLEWIRGQALGPEQEKAYFVPAKKATTTKPQPLGPDDVVDAQQGAWRRSDVQVRVVSLEMMRDNAPAQGGKSPLSLGIRLKVTNLGSSRTVRFDGWGKLGSPDGTPAVILRDGQGREYQSRGAFTGPANPSSKGAASPPASLKPRAFAEEVLLFEPPAQVAEEFFLDLSLAALETEGRLKFKIARAMMVRN
jgi:hypothetical protein